MKHRRGGCVSSVVVFLLGKWVVESMHDEKKTSGSVHLPLTERRSAIVICGSAERCAFFCLAKDH